MADALIIGFCDPQTADVLAAAPEGDVLILSDWASQPAPDLLERLAALAEPARALICLGVGDGALGALIYGRLLGANAIAVAAPGAATPFEGAEPDDVEALFDDADLDVAEQSILIVSGADSRLADLDLAGRLGRRDVRVSIDRLALPSAAAPWAMIQSGRAAEMLLGAAPRDLMATWRASFAHAIDLDLEDAQLNTAGVLTLPGRLRNCADRRLDLPERLRIGARLMRRAGDPETVIQETRSGFGRPSLGPGESLPFSLRLTDGETLTGVLEVALVCEGQFWFHEAGFPAAVLSVGLPADMDAPAPHPTQTSGSPPC